MERKPIPFVLLDDSVTTYGFRVLVSGVDTSQFEKNPVMLYDHDDWKLPIGQWSDTRKENNRILSNTGFDYDDDDKEVQRIIGKVERGVIKMASVGLADIEVSDDPVYKLEGQEGPTIIRCRLREASITPIGANHNALRLYNNDGKEIDLKEDAAVILSEFIKLKTIEKNMNAQILTLLNLSDKASDEQIEGAVNALLSAKAKAEKEAKEYKEKLAAIELAEKNARKKEAGELVDAALKDGRLTEKEDGSVRKGWLELFDQNFDAAKSALEGMKPRQSVKDWLSDGKADLSIKTGESAWEKRQAELEAMNN